MTPEKIVVALALGSNIGDKRQNLQQAVEALEERKILSQIREAPVYESDPMYLIDQPAFMNSVVVGHTALSPLDMLSALKRLETDIGRRVSVRNGPRLIDLDIILHGNSLTSDDILEIPHPRMHERPFVLQPLADILPNWQHPVTGVSIHDMWALLASHSPADGALRKVADSIR